MTRNRTLALCCIYLLSVAMLAPAQAPRPAANPAKPGGAAKPTPAKRKTSAERRADRDAERKKRAEAKPNDPADQRKAERDKKAAAATAAKAAPAKPAKPASTTTTIKAPVIPLGDFSALINQDTRLLRIRPKGAADRQDLNVIVGKEFSTEVSLDNKSMTPFEMIRVILSYDPEVLEPLAINDSSIASLIDGEPTSEVDSRAGIILYEARLTKGFVSNNSPILTIRWIGKKVSTVTHIEFGSRGDFVTALIGDGKDLLGNPKVPNDGMLNMSVIVLPEDPREAEAILAEPALMKGVDAKVGGVTLSMIPPVEPVVVGQPFSVDLVMDNTAYSNADALNVIISYNPEEIEVVDSDLDNWITLGRNILDGPFHEKFPWDFQIENQVHQARGLIMYRMGAGDSDVTRGKFGVFARINAIAKKPTISSGFEFRFSRQEQLHGTGVTYIGADALGDPNVFGDGATNLYFPILAASAKEVAASGAQPHPSSEE
ncbi:hypothetical protein IT570_10180 [Candidatus Sumerlaeota bacterium]|nr:hypothetical protein [Candidatus Sumerlaeota bacterium]